VPLGAAAAPVQVAVLGELPEHLAGPDRRTGSCRARSPPPARRVVSSVITCCRKLSCLFDVFNRQVGALRRLFGPLVAEWADWCSTTSKRARSPGERSIGIPLLDLRLQLVQKRFIKASRRGRDHSSLPNVGAAPHAGSTAPDRGRPPATRRGTNRRPTTRQAAGDRTPDRRS